MNIYIWHHWESIPFRGFTLRSQGTVLVFYFNIPLPSSIKINWIRCFCILIACIFVVLVSFNFIIMLTVRYGCATNSDICTSMPPQQTCVVSNAHASGQIVVLLGSLTPCVRSVAATLSATNWHAPWCMWQCVHHVWITFRFTTRVTAYQIGQNKPSVLPMNEHAVLAFQLYLNTMGHGHHQRHVKISSKLHKLLVPYILAIAWNCIKLSNIWFFLSFKAFMYL